MAFSSRGVSSAPPGWPIHGKHGNVQEVPGLQGWILLMDFVPSARLGASSFARAHFVCPAN